MLRRFRHILPGHRQRLIHRRQQGRSGGRPFPALRRRAQPSQRFRVARLLLGDFIDGVVLENAPARHVPFARLALAPCRDGLHHCKLLRLAKPHLEPLPGVFRVGIVGRARGEDFHLLVEPMGAAFALQLGLEMQIDVDEMRHVGQRIVELLVRQRPVAPVGETRGFVQLRAGNLLDELVIGDAVAEAADHRRHLCVEQRMRHEVAEVDDDLDVLARGVKDLHHLLVAHQAEERRQIDARRQRIDQRRRAGRRHLDQAQHRPERGLADEFGVDGDEIGLFEGCDRCFEFLLGGDDVHQTAFLIMKTSFPFQPESLSSRRSAFMPPRNGPAIARLP